MTTLELPESLPKKSETKSASLPLPILDLLNIQTSAEDIWLAPKAPEVKRLAGQILEDCTDDMPEIRDLAEQIRACSSPDERAELAWQIVLSIDALLEAGTVIAPVAAMA